MNVANGRAPQGPRLIAIVGPYQSGKTTVLEALMYRAGVISRQGKSIDKTLVGDASAEARAHGMSIDVNIAGFSFMDERFIFVDCPGSVEFSNDAKAVLPVCDAAIVVVDADAKKAPALQLILRELDALGLPRIVFLNKIDKADATPRDVLAWMQPASSKPLMLRQLPIWSGGVVTGFVDLALERAHIYQELSESRIVDMPAGIEALEKQERFSLLETLADHDDALMEQLLTDLEPPRDQIFDDLKRDVMAGHVTPVLFGSAEHGHGIGRLLKTLRHDTYGVARTAERLGLVPTVSAVAQIVKTQHTSQGGKLSIARVLSGVLNDGATMHDAKDHEARIAGIAGFSGGALTKQTQAQTGDVVALGRLEAIATGQTVSTARGACVQLIEIKHATPVYGFAVSVADRKDEVKLTSAIGRLMEEDPALNFEHNAETGDLVLWGQGEMHLQVTLEKLASKFGVKAIQAARKIAYKETIRKSVSLRGRHKKQSGGHGQYGDVVVDITPLPRGSGFQFTNTIAGGVVPKQYIPAVEQGIREWMVRGTLGFPVVDFAVNLAEGSYHDVDSSEMAFKMAARVAMVDGMPQCLPVLLEPIMALDIHVPSENTARANQIVTGHRGQVLGFDVHDSWPGWDTVKAYMPEAELASLIIEIRSATAGVGTFEMRYDHLAELSGKAAEQATLQIKAQAA